MFSTNRRNAGIRVAPPTSSTCMNGLINNDILEAMTRVQDHRVVKSSLRRTSLMGCRRLGRSCGPEPTGVAPLPRRFLRRFSSWSAKAVPRSTPACHGEGYHCRDGSVGCLTAVHGMLNVRVSVQG